MKFTIGIVVVILIVGGMWYATSQQAVAPSASVSPTPDVSVAASPDVATTRSPEAGVVEGPVKTFAVSGGSFYFDPKEIRVNKGDRVKIVFTNVEGFHDWVIDEFNARTPQMKAGEVSTIEFVADKTGTFQYYCSVGAHRSQGMWGNLIVQ